MKRKLFLVLLLAAVAATGVFAQEKAKNTITGGLDLGIWTGFSIDYERVLVDGFLGKGQFALGVEAGYDSYWFIFPSVFFDVQAKWYPWSGKFYADLGVGYGQLIWVVPSIMITAGVGWKFDIGQPNGWVLDFGPSFDYFIVINEFEGTSVNIRARAQIGYSW
jgi:hypothetical protein